MQFKTERLRQEFYELLTKQNDKLAEVINCLDKFVTWELNKVLTITSILRTQEEQDMLYVNVPEDKKVRTSPHMFWKAVDIRSTDFTDAEKKRMLAFLNCFTYHSGQGRPVAICHMIAGNVEHFHIQCD